MTSAGLVTREFLVNHVTHAFSRVQRVERIVDTALDIFRSKNSSSVERAVRDTPEVNIKVEGRIILQSS